MTDSIKRTTEDRSEARRRLHLRDITNELPDVADDRAGTELRAARERRGQDLRAIADSLRIRRVQLEALEESRYDDLPGRAYAVGFIRSYAEYLGLDSAEIVERYKSEIDAHFAEGEALPFPELQEQTRLPRGSFLVIALFVLASVYGAYLMTRSADRMMAERVPNVPGQMEVNVATNSPEERPASLSGDPASASTRPASDTAAAQLLGNSASADVETSGVYAVPPVVAETPAEAPAQVAALTPVSDDAALAPAGDAASASDNPSAAIVSGLPDIPPGHVYGVDNSDSRVTVRARKNDAWIRVEDAQGHVLIERVLQTGDVYHAPNVPGAILVARDASAFELLVDKQSLGLAGPPTLVLTGKPLEPAALLAAMPRSLPTPAQEAAAIAPVAPAATH
ncbi:MAG: RodZ domain-containing protein [Parvibaculum sp.]